MKRAFTLIELLITTAIIAFMAAIVVPAFDKYGAKSSFKLQASEIQSLINQANIMAKNPEQSISRYIIKADTASTPNTIGLYRTNDAAANLIKQIKMPSGYTLLPVTNNYLVCNTPSSFCCDTSQIVDCVTPVVTYGFITMSSSDTDDSVTFNISSNPFRAEF